MLRNLPPEAALWRHEDHQKEQPRQQPAYSDDGMRVVRAGDTDAEEAVAAFFAQHVNSQA